MVSDPWVVLTALLDSSVEFIVIGGTAQILHGAAKLYRDTDIVVRLDEANLKRAAQSIRELQLGFLQPGIRLFSREVEWTHLLDSPLVLRSDGSSGPPVRRLDVFTDVIELGSYEDVSHQSNTIDLDGRKLQVASLEQLQIVSQALIDEDPVDSRSQRDQMNLAYINVLQAEIQRSQTDQGLWQN